MPRPTSPGPQHMSRTRRFASVGKGSAAAINSRSRRFATPCSVHHNCNSSSRFALLSFFAILVSVSGGVAPRTVFIVFLLRGESVLHLLVARALSAQRQKS